MASITFWLVSITSTLLRITRLRPVTTVRQARMQTDQFWGRIAGEHRLLACRIRLPADCFSGGNKVTSNLVGENIPSERTFYI